MATTLTPNPYTALGVSTTATVAEIRSAHRKLVLKCHPDKVQDPELKAVKQDEFQRVQQAYELLTDDKRRQQFDDAIKLAELRKEMGRSGPLPGGKTVFDYEVREAAPRQSTFKEPSKMYAQPPPRSYEDEIGSRGFEEPLRAKARKTASYEQPKRPSTREEEKRRKAEDERDRERWEKEMRKSAQGSARKTRDKERRKGGEEKYSRATAAYAEDDDSEDAYPPKMDRRTARKLDERMEAEIRLREQQARSDEKSRKDKDAAKVLAEKVDLKKSYAAEYMLASRRKAGPAAPPAPQIIEDEFRAKPTMRRAETFDYPSSRYPPTSPFIVEEEDDYVRRSSARPTPRRASEQIPITRSSREIPRSTGREHKSSAPYDPNAPFIVEAAPSPARKPSLQSHSSAPPIITSLPTRKEPHRSRTTPLAYSAPPPPMMRSQTFNSPETSSKPSKSASKGSKLKNPISYVTSDSDSDDIPYTASPRSVSPPPAPRRREEVRYVIDKGTNRSIPVVPGASRHRTALREDDYTNPRDLRERSESPRGTPARRSTDRPPLTRSSGSSRPSSSSRPQAQPYYQPSVSPQPIIIPVRPKGPVRENSSNSARYHSPSAGYGAHFGEVQYATNYGPEHVSYSQEGYRRGSDPHYGGYPKAAYT